MENIRQAVERARVAIPDAKQSNPADPTTPLPQLEPGYGRSEMNDSRIHEISLNGVYLETNRIISHDGADPRSKAFDMLRTQVLRSMDLKDWKVLAVTSPTAACGKTVTAINLALSVARQSERSVLLVDMDLQRPQVANCLGIERSDGLLDVLKGRATLRAAIIQVRVGNQRLMVLPTNSVKSGSSEWMASQALSAVLQDIRRDYRSSIVIIDLPPMLSSDDAITVLPQIDCVLLVAAAGISSVAEITECNKHLQSADVVRLVLNKVTDSATP